MVAAAAPVPSSAVVSPGSRLERGMQAGMALAPARAPRLRARPLPVAAYPAGVPRWVTYDGRRQRVVAIVDQQPLDPALAPVPAGTRRMQVELADGRVLTLLHSRAGWFERA